MEIILVVIGTYFVVVGLRKSVRRQHRKITRPFKPAPRRPRTVRNAPQRNQSPKPFDAQTAEVVRPYSTIEGPAYVIDGDSIVIKKTQVRLFGVDAPEMNHPYGKKAKWALLALCKGQTVRAEIIERDAHDRTVAKCYLPDGRDLSAEMVKQGLAIDWPKFSGGKYRDLEVPDARKKMWLADARQKGRMHVWEQFEYNQMRKKRGAAD